MDELNDRIRQRLFAMQDTEYRDFNARLLPTVDPASIIGVRTPELRKLAREIAREPNFDPFTKQLPHEFYEENNLHALLLCQYKDLEQLLAALTDFLPWVDNWATCDILRPKLFAKNQAAIWPAVKAWLDSEHCYTRRFAIGTLMAYYLDDHFEPKYPELVAAVRSEEYYVRMMVAWYFATALAKQWESCLPILTEKRLDVWTHNKTIQKAIESLRITAEQKAFLKTLRRRNCFL